MLTTILLKNLERLEIKKDLLYICYNHTLVVVAAYCRYTQKIYRFLQESLLTFRHVILLSLFLSLLFLGFHTISTYWPMYLFFKTLKNKFLIILHLKTIVPIFVKLWYSLIKNMNTIHTNFKKFLSIPLKTEVGTIHVSLYKGINIESRHGRSILFLCVKAPSMFQRRYMFKSTIRSTTFLTRSCTITFQKATLTNEAAKLKGKAAEDLSNDDKKNHTHRIVEICPKFECPQKHCVNPCALPTKRYIDGHNTHNPPSHKPSKLISNIDVNGDLKPQHFVECNPRTEIKKNYKANEIKFDKKTKTYIDANHDKYEN